MPLGRRISVPQAIYIWFIEGKKLQSSLGIQWPEYNFTPAATQWRVRSKLKRNAGWRHYSPREACSSGLPSTGECPSPTKPAPKARLEHQTKLRLPLLPDSWGGGGFVASQAGIANDQGKSFVGRSHNEDADFRGSLLAEPFTLEELLPSDRASAGETPDPVILAYSVEFVALPGRTEELRTMIPDAMRIALANSRAFSGCMVLLSEQEARLVTVITFWTGRDRAKHCTENSKQVESLLLPYVDDWLRTRRMTAFLCWPQHPPSSERKSRTGHA